MNEVIGGLHLLPKRLLVRTSGIDRAAWNYDGVLGYVSRQRFRLVTSLLPQRKLGRILEIGYGSGVFLPELARRADHVSGVDLHDRAREVELALTRVGVVADLARAGAESLPYERGTFDVVVAVSALEFVADLDASLREISRVVAPGGRAIVVTPGDHPLLDLGLRLATGASASEEFGDRRARVVRALMHGMRVVRIRRFPRFSPIPVYRAFELEPQGK